MTTFSRATTTFAAAWRRSRLFLMASATAASSPGSLNDFSQSLATASFAIELALHVAGIVVLFGKLSFTTLECCGGCASEQPTKQSPAKQANRAKPLGKCRLFQRECTNPSLIRMASGTRS